MLVALLMHGDEVRAGSRTGALDVEPLRVCDALQTTLNRSTITISGRVATTALLLLKQKLDDRVTRLWQEVLHHMHNTYMMHV